MNNTPIKRRNPFDRPINQERVEPNEEKVQEIKEEPVVEENEEQEEEEVVIERPKPQVQRPKPQKTTSKSRYYDVDESEREKFTSTMQVTLRRRIKIVCATRGIMFSEFIEEACREKLNREGER